MTLSDFASRLERYCRGRAGFAPDCRVGGLRRMPGGWESEVHAFELEGVAASGTPLPPLVLRLYAGTGAGETATKESRCLRRLRGLEYPVPRVIRCEATGEDLGRPFLIMERVEGEVLGALLPRAVPAEREALLARFCRLFARLHELPSDEFRKIVPPIDRTDPQAPGSRALHALAESVARHSIPGFRPALGWLEERRNSLACPRLSPVHLDFHPYNVLRTPSDRLVVLDWTGFGLSDSRLDLAWTLVLAHSFEGPAYRERLLRGYEAATGASVAGIEPFEAVACLRRLIDLTVSLSGQGEARGLRPEAVAAMRRMVGAHRRVYELLLARIGVRVPEVEQCLADLGTRPIG